MSNGAIITPTGVAGLVTTQPSRFTVIQPNLLPPMQVLESISTDQIITDRMTKLVQLWAANDPPNAAQYDVGGLEFDPLKIQAELAAYFELMLRDRVNQACRAITLAFAVGGDLDAVGSRYPYGVSRKTVVAGTWSGPGTQEPDNMYRQRLWLSPGIFSLSGPGQGTWDSYVFWALSAPMPTGELPLQDAHALTVRQTGVVTIPIMSTVNWNTTWTQTFGSPVWMLTPGADPTPSKAQLAAVYQYITALGAARKGLTDEVQVVPPKITPVPLNIQFWTYPGVDTDSTLTNLSLAVVQLLQSLFYLGADLTELALMATLAQAGVFKANLVGWTGDTNVGPAGCFTVPTVVLNWQGTGE